MVEQNSMLIPYLRLLTFDIFMLPVHRKGKDLEAEPFLFNLER